MTTAEAERSLTGLRVFLAEDEFPVLQLIEDMIEELGCRIAGSVTNISAALEAAETTDADIAILDVNLRGQNAFPVAAILKRRGIPILFSTGYGPAGLDAEWKDFDVIQKPFPLDIFRSAIERTMRESR
jgi:DNA-binding response OmpR family regulator